MSEREPEHPWQYLTPAELNTLLHAAELLEREAAWYRDLQWRPQHINDLLATARALREPCKS